MRNMIIALTALTGIACGGPVADAEAYADAVCDCEDQECVDKVKEDFEEKAKEAKSADLSDDDKDAISKANDKAIDCLKKM